MKYHVFIDFFKRLTWIVCLLVLISLGGKSFLHAQNRSAFVYDKELVRLGEVLGALHYLHKLCGEEEPDWRAFMERVIAAEAPDEARRARFIAAFNRAYHDFSENYHQCTLPARTAIDMYKEEGITLSNALINRYGN